jgi:long-subunit acyl-CoA synthetase (AMP-forming)
LAADIAAETRKLVCFEDHASGRSLHNPEVRIAPTDTALLVYTSGSMGHPKAVMLTHQQLIHIGEIDRCRTGALTQGVPLT